MPAGWWAFVLHLVTIFGLALSNAFQVLAVLLGAGQTQRNRSAALRSPDAQKLLYPLSLYALFFLVSALFSFEPERSIHSLGSLVSLLTLPLALFWLRGEQQVRLVVDWVLLAISVFALYGIVQFAITNNGPDHFRIPGPFSHYMTFSGVMLIGLCLLVARLMAWNRQRFQQHHMASRELRAAPQRLLPFPAVAFAWIQLAAILIALGLSLTRSSWLAAALAILLALTLRRRRRAWALPVSALAALLLVAVLSPEAVGSRLRSMVDLDYPSNYDRVCMAWAGWHMVSEKPLFGIGPGQVEERYPIYRHPTSWRLHVKHLHNTFVHMAAERGLLQLGAYLWLTLAALGLAWRRFKAERDKPGTGATDLMLGVVLVLVAFNFAGLFEANWRDTELQRLVLFLMALPACLSLEARS